VIPRGSLDFIQALAAGKSVLAACEAAIVAEPCFDLSENLADLIRVGAVFGFGYVKEPLPT
jgi:hypothetical protein